MKEQDLLFQKRLHDLSRMCFYREIPVFTDFLDLNELHIVHSFSPEEPGVTIHFSGGYEEAERQIAAFIPDALSYNSENEDFIQYPMVCLKISPLSRKFCEKLTHRDYLGALLHLGIERCKIGDLVLQDQDCFVFACENMAQFLMDNLDKVRHTNVSVSLVDDLEELPAPKMKQIQGTVASVRLDSIIALAFGSSRSSMTGLIEGGKVFVNGRMVVSNGYNLKPGDIVTVRGYGKFRYEDTLNKTKKGRYSVILYRYGE